MYARPVYTPHPRNFTFYRPARPAPRPIARIGQTAPGGVVPNGQFPAPSSIPTSTLPGTDGLTPTLPAEGDTQNRVQVVWPYLILASIVGGAAFAVGAGLVNKYIFGK